MATERQKELHRRRVRRLKLKKLRVRYQASHDASVKEKIIQKAARIAPWISEKEFVDLAK